MLVMRSIPVVTMVAALAIAGCGGSSEEDDPAAQRERFEDAAVKFAQCMREQGIDMPDPEGGRIELHAGGPGGPSPEKVEAAQEKCQPVLEEAGGPPELSEEDRAEFEKQALAFARCMRRQGIDMPDPEFEGGGRMLQRMREPRGGGGRTSRGPDDPLFREAEEKCREFAPERPGGPGRR
jgi:hypothetical protein